MATARAAVAGGYIAAIAPKALSCTDLRRYYREDGGEGASRRREEAAALSSLYTCALENFWKIANEYWVSGGSVIVRETLCGA